MTELHPMRKTSSTTPMRFAIIAFFLFLIVSILSRGALILQAKSDISWNASIIVAFFSGFCFDVIAGCFAAGLWALLACVTPNKLWRVKLGKFLYIFLLTLYVGALIWISMAEWFFWDEFGARFNFIAVDYLVFTTEVLANINQSYPMLPLMSGIVVFALVIIFLIQRKGMISWATKAEKKRSNTIYCALAAIVVPTLLGIFISQSMVPNFANQYNKEIAKNGCWSFFAAYNSMEIDYETYYECLPLEESLAKGKKILATENEIPSSSDLQNFSRSITSKNPEKKANVITVCMESMSGEYMSYLGNKKGLTPNLDRLANESLFFKNLRATGTRTVRGMEAITLNLPPTPGQAIIRRPEGVNLVTTFTQFLSRNYDCAFVYGGHGEFDDMNRYFSGSGCRISDKGDWKKSDITHETAWGACDEDLFNKTISEADENHAKGKPFNFFCMTTSNHRPYHFPAGRIDMPEGSRDSAIKYADWAVGDLISKASKKPWFNDTIFVIIADHCASSSGKMDLDVRKYHIPAMIYCPSIIPAQKISKLCSQIDVMPTLFGLLNWNYQTLSYGHDMLAPSAAALKGRAFISNYQKIAMLTDENLVILKPNRINSVYSCDQKTGFLIPLKNKENFQLIEDATVYYQTASWLFKYGKLKDSSRTLHTSN
jgi:phosphoglycerol transferase MdoB-like AlkP superfamily enzyme